MPLDEDDLTKIAALINKANENSLTAEQIAKVVDDKIGGLKLDEKILSAVDASAPKKKDDDDKGDKNDKAGDEYAARMADLEAKQRAAEEREASAISREREARMGNQLAEALTANGIPRDRHAQTIAYLRTKKSAHSGKDVFGFDDNGQPTFRKAGKGYDDSVSIADGVKAWSQSDEAKLYKPAADRRGSGGGEGSGRGSGGGKETSVNELISMLPLS